MRRSTRSGSTRDLEWAHDERCRGLVFLAEWWNGRHKGFKIPRGVIPVRVRVPPRPLEGMGLPSAATPKLSQSPGFPGLFSHPRQPPPEPCRGNSRPLKPSSLTNCSITLPSPFRDSIPRVPSDRQAMPAFSRACQPTDRLSSTGQSREAAAASRCWTFRHRNDHELRSDSRPRSTTSLPPTVKSRSTTTAAALRSSVPIEYCRANCPRSIRLSAGRGTTG